MEKGESSFRTSEVILNGRWWLGELIYASEKARELKKAKSAEEKDIINKKYELAKLQTNNLIKTPVSLIAVDESGSAIHVEGDVVKIDLITCQLHVKTEKDVVPIKYADFKPVPETDYHKAEPLIVLETSVPYKF